MSEYINNPYLTFIGEEKDFTLTATNKGWTGTLEYSTNKTNWYIWDGSAIQSAGLLLYLRGKGNSRLHNVRLVLSERAGCYGNINVLLDYENPFPESLPSIGENFYCLFYNCTNLITAPELPAMGLRDLCYSNMFTGTSITEPPELPATTMTHGCYYQMFRNCQQLKRAPELSATILASSCYYQMFYNCKSLKQPPSKLPATEAAASCYYNMFESCTSLQTLPKIYLTKLANYCMNGMFYKCSKLHISTTKAGEYTIPWRFPAVGTVDNSTTSSTDWNHGTFAATAIIPYTELSSNTVYYLKSPATEQQLFSRICLKGDTYANWTSSNPILKENEIGIYTDSKNFKIGDGTSKASSLPFYIPDSINVGDLLLTSNTHGGKKLYISKIDDAFYCADKRWHVHLDRYNGDTLVNSTWDIADFFDGNYDTYKTISAGYKGIITFDFSNTSTGYLDIGYPYGNVIISFYDTFNPESVSMRVYCNYSSQGIGWKDLTTEYVKSYGNGQIIKAYNSYYNISKLEITVNAKSTSAVNISEIEFDATRKSTSNNPFVTKYTEERLYYPLTAPSFNGSLNGNAATATKLQTSRSISLGTAVTATATKFDGSANITVPVTEVKEAYLTWGGKDYAGGFGPLDAALIGDLSINRLAGLPESQWKFERSSDAGETWEEYTGPVGMDIGTVINSSSTAAKNANTKDSQSVNNWHRITIDVVGYIYCELRKIALYFTTNGASGCKCKIEWGDKSSPTVWTTEKETPVNGWSGWNIIQVNKIIGGSAASYPRYIRLTFSQTGLNSNYPSNCSVSSIRFYAQNCWSAVGDIGLRGTPYQFNKYQEVTFKNSISVPNGSINTGGQVYAVGNVNGKNVYAKESMQAPTITATTSVTAPKFIGDAQGVTGIAATSNVARRVWFSDGDYETRRGYDDDFKYNPYSNTLSVGKITGTAQNLYRSTTNFKQNLPPNDVALVPESFANRFACYPSNLITVEHSQDDGSTWTTSTADSDVVSTICTNCDFSTLYVGGQSGTAISWKTRVTFDIDTSRQTSLEKFIFFTHSPDINIVIDYYNGSTWATCGAGTIGGNPGISVINLDINVLYEWWKSGTKLRMTFTVVSLTGIDAKIVGIKAIGANYITWTNTNYLAKFGTPYYCDKDGRTIYKNGITAPQITVSNDPVNNTDATNKAYVDEKSKLYLHSITYAASNSNDGYSSEGVINLYTKSSTEITDFFEIYNTINTATSTSIAGFINGPLGINIARRFNIEGDGSSMWIYAILSDGSIDSINVNTIDSIFDNVVEIL